MAMDYRSRDYALLNTDAETPRHVRRVKRFLDPLPDEDILDVGCGRGFLLKEIQNIAPRTRGVDINPQAIAHTIARDVSVMDAQRLDFPCEHFDKVYSFHMIEHVPDLPAALSEMERVLRPGGTLLLVYPAEPIRGLFVIPSAMMLFGNPFRALDLHLHRLTPARVRNFASQTSFWHVESELNLLLTPQFVTVLRKPIGMSRSASYELRAAS